MVFEDLHWIDAETQALLDSLVESLPIGAPAAARELPARVPARLGRQDLLQPAAAGRAPGRERRELLDALLGDDPGAGAAQAAPGQARATRSSSRRRVRTLVETKALAGERGAYRLTQPVQAIQVPATVQAILAARIDRLAPEDKRLLQVAAVIGKDVPFALLQAIAELPEEALRRGLDHLQAAEFLYETGLFPDLEYTFKHALTHEVAYGSLLQERRRELHARIVEAIETLYRDRLGEQVERLAHHAVRGELWEKAVRLSPAGRSSRRPRGRRSRMPGPGSSRRWASSRRCRRARPRWSRPSTSASSCGRCCSSSVKSGGSLERLREAEALAERLNDDRRRGRVCAFMTNAHSLLGELDEALVTGTRALEIAERLGDLRLRILTTTYLEQAHYYRGEYGGRSSWPPTTSRRCPPTGSTSISERRAAIGLRSRLAGHEPRPARPIRRGGRVRSRGDPARRADAACRTPSAALTGPRHAPPRSRATGRRRAR